MKKRIAAFIMAAVLSVSAAVTAFAGVWEYDEGDWYFYESPDDYSEEELLTGWQWIDGYCYFLDPDEGGAMAVTRVTPVGFPVNEVGRMTDAYGEPYYIPGWGYTATTPGPADYEAYLDDEYYSEIIYGEPSGNHALSHIFDLDILYDIMRRRERGDDGARRRAPDTVVIVVGGQSDKPEGQPETVEGKHENAEELPEIPEEKPENPVIRAGGNARRSDTEEKAEIPEEKPENPVIKAGENTKKSETEEKTEITEEKPENPVIKAGGNTKKSETEEKSDKAEEQSEKQQTERSAARTQRNQAGSGSTQGRSESGNASRSRSGSQGLDPSLWYLLGLE